MVNYGLGLILFTDPAVLRTPFFSREIVDMWRIMSVVGVAVMFQNPLDS